MKFSVEEKARLLEGWKKSGKSISSYVRENGLVRWTFTKWLKAERDAKPCFVEVKPQAMPSAPRATEMLVEKRDLKIHVPLGLGRDELRAVMEGLGGVLW